MALSMDRDLWGALTRLDRLRIYAPFRRDAAALGANALSSTTFTLFGAVWCIRP